MSVSLLRCTAVLVALAALTVMPTLAHAATQNADVNVFGDESKPTSDVPLSMHALEDIPSGQPLSSDKAPPLNIRKDALREAALSLGARGGLAYRSYQIREHLKTYETSLDKVFDFRQLLMAAPSGLLIEPPIVSESDDALIIDPQGLKAAVSDRIYGINKNARIVTAPRTWHTYLEREWGTIELPPDLLRPKDDDERKIWRDNIRKGWQQGIDQADETFNNDLMRLTADFTGMVRYRKLLAQGMISAPFALQTDRGVTGGGRSLRIGDRAIQMTGVPQLIRGTDRWQPANQ